MKLSLLQKGFNYSQDGPGNRLVIHLQGCNLHCPWCSNPESMEFGRRDTDVAELIDLCVRSKPMMFDGGGVTLTGGEPTVQTDAVAELLKGLKDEEIDTCIETNGTQTHLPELFPFLDHLIIDLKHHDSSVLRAVTGAGNEVVVDNIRQALLDGVDTLIRIPLIHGFNSSQADATSFSELLSSMPSYPLKVELLRYHEYGKDKWAKIGKPYAMTADAFVGDDEFDAFCLSVECDKIKLIRT